MGTDIHMFIEKRIDNQFPWEADEGHIIEMEYGYSRVKEVSAESRNYFLFGILASVRYDKCLFEPRGLPTDASDLIVKAYEDMGPDGHTHSYLDLEEFKKCLIKADYDLESSDRKDAFYRWDDWKKPDGKYDFDKHPPAYVTIVNYCQAWIDKIKQEDFLGIDEYRPEVRIVFWFDS